MIVAHVRVPPGLLKKSGCSGSEYGTFHRIRLIHSQVCEQRFSQVIARSGKLQQWRATGLATRQSCS